MLEVIQDLREISLRCQQGKPLDVKHLNWLGDSLRKFLDHQCSSVDEALGIKNPRGGVPWWREEQMRIRDDALRDISRYFPTAGSTTEMARKICQIANRYAAGAWRIDQNLDAMRGHYAGTPRECLWKAFKSGAPMPLGERQVRQIIGNMAPQCGLNRHRELHKFCSSTSSR